MKLKTLTEDELIHHALNGSQAHLDALIAIYEPFILNSLEKKIQNHADLLDIRQKVCCKIVDQFNKKNYLHQERFSHWTTTIIRSELNDYFRLKKRNRMYFTDKIQDLCPIQPDIQELAEDDIYLNYNVMDFLKDIPFEQAFIIKLKCVENKTFKEISVLTNMSINTVMGRYRYGIEKIRSLIREKAPQ